MRFSGNATDTMGLRPHKVGEKPLAETQLNSKFVRLGPRRGSGMSAGAVDLFVFCMVFNLFWVIVFLLLRKGLEVTKEHSIELFLAIIGIDFSIVLDAIDISGIVWLPFIAEYQKPIFGIGMFAAIIAAIFVAKWERRAGKAAADFEPMTWWRVVGHLFWHKWRLEAFATVLRWTTVTAHTFWIMKLPRWL
jgi:hypothetical protein